MFYTSHNAFNVIPINCTLHVLSVLSVNPIDTFCVIIPNT